MSAVAMTKADVPEITFHWDEKPYEAFYAEIHISGLVHDHWNEVGTLREILHFNPLHEAYRNAERAGYLHVLTARDHGELVGYFTVILMPHARDRDALVGRYSDLYVTPAYRKYMLGIKLQKEGERKLGELGAHIVLFGERASHSEKSGNRGGYLKRMGYKKVETIYAKVLKLPHGDSHEA